MTSQPAPAAPAAPTSTAAKPPKEPYPVYNVRAPEPMNEAGAVALFSLNTPGGAEIKFTIRCQIGRELIDEILDTVSYAVSKGFKAPLPPANAPRQTQGQATQARTPQPPATPVGAGAKPPAKPATAQPAAPPKGTPASGEPLVMDVIKMEVTPQVDGKVKLDFFAAGREFADLHATLPVNRALAILGGTGDWDASHFEKHIVYIVDYRITYKLGKVNPKSPTGNPFKDIMKIELLDAPQENPIDPNDPLNQ